MLSVRCTRVESVWRRVTRVAADQHGTQDEDQRGVAAEDAGPGPRAEGAGAGLFASTEPISSGRHREKALFAMRTYGGRVKPVTGDSPPFDAGGP
jgi:hypothetical protein